MNSRAEQALWSCKFGGEYRWRTYVLHVQCTPARCRTWWAPTQRSRHRQSQRRSWTHSRTPQNNPNMLSTNTRIQTWTYTYLPMYDSMTSTLSFAAYIKPDPRCLERVWGTFYAENQMGILNRYTRACIFRTWWNLLDGLHPGACMLRIL